MNNSTDIDGLVQDCSNCNALAMELLQSYTKPSIFGLILLQGDYSHQQALIQYKDCLSQVWEFLC